MVSGVVRHADVQTLPSYEQVLVDKLIGNHAETLHPASSVTHDSRPVDIPNPLRIIRRLCAQVPKQTEVRYQKVGRATTLKIAIKQAAETENSTP
jgi:hypothetical protein